MALATGGALAQDLKFPVGEGAFNWDSYKAYDEATNLDGQTLKIFGPCSSGPPWSPDGFSAPRHGRGRGR